MRLFGVSVPPALDAAVASCRDHFRLAAALSALVNILYLAPTIYMMQVYDRVVPTQGTTTLIWLTVLIAFALATLVALDALRSRVMLRASVRLDNQLAQTILDHTMNRRDAGLAGRAPRQAMREFDNLRQAVAGTSAIALFDIPWTPVYILVAFLVHPAIGLLAAVASFILLGITLANERANRATGLVALQAMGNAYAAQERIAQRAEVIRALGMRKATVGRLRAERERGLHLTMYQQVENGRYASAVKFCRLLLQSLALGLGAWLAVLDQISAGSIIASSVLLGRALQPIEALVGSWASITQARQAIQSLGTLLTDAPAICPAGQRFELPVPNGALSVRDMGVDAPDPGGSPLLADISFDVEPGELIGIIGPSGAGKSMLARVIAGALTPDHGMVRIDGADMLDWEAERLALHIGYLPQDAALLPGTIAENISRFALARGDAPEAVTAAILKAAEIAGVHQLIVALPGGYDRRIGWGGEELSTGQRQRVALARAIYGDPVLFVLDEPNSALDADGENALTQAIGTVRARGATVLMVTHRAQLLSNATRLLLLVNGTMSMFGEYQQVLAALQRPASTRGKSATPREITGTPELAGPGVH
ncbi:type I secretion system permease/ATPase [Sphingomonas sp.]|uniref:type I secretion system permease/ATPase n=1 Tax=Sphingomonas sp. TaxID=28214 RepID=UPI0025D06EFE|nr:type I secretion system permease/ATPase [Sphingomonas sp.]